MQQWEYLEVYVDVNTATWQDSRGHSGDIPGRHRRLAPDDVLNALGAEGWELTGCLPIGSAGYYYSLFMKRPRLQGEAGAEAKRVRLRAQRESGHRTATAAT